MFANDQLNIRAHFPADEVIPVNLSIERAGQLIGISRPSVYPLIAAGELDSVRVGGRRLIPTRSVVAYLERISNRTARKNGGCGSRETQGVPSSSPDSFFTMSGSSPPKDVAESEGDAK